MRFPCAYCGTSIVDRRRLPDRLYAQCWTCWLRDNGRATRTWVDHVAAWFRGRA